jgi:hypothetical protein
MLLSLQALTKWEKTLEYLRVRERIDKAVSPLERQWYDTRSIHSQQEYQMGNHPKEWYGLDDTKRKSWILGMSTDVYLQSHLDEKLDQVGSDVFVVDIDDSSILSYFDRKTAISKFRRQMEVKNKKRATANTMSDRIDRQLKEKSKGASPPPEVAEYDSKNDDMQSLLAFIMQVGSADRTGTSGREGTDTESGGTKEGSLQRLTNRLKHIVSHSLSLSQRERYEKEKDMKTRMSELSEQQQAASESEQHKMGSASDLNGGDGEEAFFDYDNFAVSESIGHGVNEMAVGNGSYCGRNPMTRASASEPGTSRSQAGSHPGTDSSTLMEFKAGEGDFGMRWPTIIFLNAFVQRSFARFLSECFLCALPPNMTHFPLEKTVSVNVPKLLKSLNVKSTSAPKSRNADPTAMHGRKNRETVMRNFMRNKTSLNIEDVFCLELVDSPAFVDLLARHGPILDSHAFF